jgi:hypothetical protein
LSPKKKGHAPTSGNVDQTIGFSGPHSTDFPLLKPSKVAKLVWLSMPLLLVKLYKIHEYPGKSHC